MIILSGFLFLLLISINLQGEENHCKTCKDLVKKVNESIFKTRTSTFSGGNADYEKKKLVSYEISETRLNDIFEEIVHNGPKNSLLLSTIEENLETWWSLHFIKNPKDFSFQILEDTVCKVDFCCPVGHYGKGCKKCATCNPSGGKCNGDSFQIGTGACDCQNGYKGTTCNECSDSHFLLKKNTGGWSICHQCKANCKTCTDKNDCSECLSGYRLEDEKCQDINECEEQKNICPEEGQFCKNQPGGYNCSLCGNNCKTCTGDKEDECTSCHHGFELQGTECKDIDECELEIAHCDEDNQVCENKPGSFECKCKENFYKPEGKSECIPKEEGEGSSNKDEL